MQNQEIPFWLKRNIELLEAKNENTNDLIAENQENTDDALIELAGLQDDSGASIRDIENALIELAEMIAGG